MEMAENKDRCPFLREDKVAFCRAFPLRKPLPFDKIYARENLCLKGEYLRCPIYREKEGGKERTPKRICPFLEIETVMYCDLFPIKKMIPSSCYKLECPCTTERYTECPLFLGMAKGDLSTPSVMEEVGGFSLGPYMYCEGHFWLQEEGEERVKMGLDDFGQFLIGPIKGISLPGRGQRLTKGHPFITLISRSGEVQLPAPLSGDVVEVNEEVQRDPSLVNFDPYGRGWLLQVQPEGWSRQRGLLHGEEAKRWLAEEVERLRYLLQSEIGVTMADGGELLRDRLQEVGRERWDLLVETFLKKGGMKNVGSP